MAVMSRRLSDFLDTSVLAAMCAVRVKGVDKTGAELDPLVNAIHYDSRKIKSADVYFALRGLHVDGRDFIDNAIAAGASVIVYDGSLDRFENGVVYLKAKDARLAMSPFSAAYHGCPSRELGLIGVTGTEGKSTTVFLIYQILSMTGHKTGFVSTVQYRTAETEEWNPDHQTTPEAPTVQAALAAMRDYGMEYAVLEASSHGLSPRTGRLADVDFDVGVMTNVTHEHLEFHGTWENYRNDKARLFSGLNNRSPLKQPGGPDARRVPAFGVVNADDPSAAFFQGATERRTYTYSVAGAEADVSLKALVSEADGNHYELYVRSSGELLRFRDYLPGAFNAGNVLAALLVVSGLLSRPLSELIQYVPRLRGVRGRMTAIRSGQDFELIVDYAHTPSSFETVLPSLKRRLEEHGGRLITLFGSGGERDKLKRPQQGRIAARWSDIVVLTDEDPRGEQPMELLEEIAAGCEGLRQGENLFLIPDRPMAIRKALSFARPGDAVILLGKGHENSIIYKDKILSYDEINEAKKALSELGYGGLPS